MFAWPPLQVRMLGERQGTLTSLMLRVCDISRHDADVPLVFDLQPLAQASLAIINCALNIDQKTEHRMLSIPQALQQYHKEPDSFVSMMTMHDMCWSEAGGTFFWPTCVSTQVTLHIIPRDLCTMALQAGFPKLTHFVVESSCHGPVRLVAVDGLPLLSEHCMPSLKLLALKGLSQVPLSTERTSRRRYSSLPARCAPGSFHISDHMVFSA